MPVVEDFALAAGFRVLAPEREGLEAFAMADSLNKVRGMRLQSHCQCAPERQILPPFRVATDENFVTFIPRPSIF